MVRYDSGFAPNPFYGFCTLATCKPDIRRTAEVNDWVIGTGSADRRINLGGHLVYAMKVTEALTFKEYWNDHRFRRKKPNLTGSKKMASGDNIYNRDEGSGAWNQLNSYHSLNDGTPNLRHVNRDTSVDRVLISNDFVYFGGGGPPIPERFRNYNGKDICKAGQGRKVFSDSTMIESFVSWVRELSVDQYVTTPQDWLIG